MSETDNLPAVRQAAPAAVTSREVDSWVEVAKPMVWLAEQIADTEFVPRAFRGNPFATAAAMLYGREVGFGPMTALNQTHVIEGRPSLSAEAMRALVLSAGHQLEVVETDGSKCVMRGRRAGSTTWTTVTWTLDMARVAGLLSKQNWQRYPRAQLAARATTELCRLIFADVIHGMGSVEEAWDEAGSEAVPTEEAPARANGRTKVQRAAKRTKTDDGAAAPEPATPPAGPGPSAASSSPALPPLPGEPGYDGTETPALAGEVATSTTTPMGQDSGPLQGTGPADASDPGSGETASDRRASGRSVEDPPGQDAQTEQPDEQLSKDQQKAMHAAFNKLDIKDRAERLHITQAILGRDIASSNDLTKREASTLLDALAHCKTRDHVEALVQMAEQQRAGGEDS